MGRLEGKTALVTGAARGQGAAEARLFVEEGARVLICDVLEAAGRKLCAEIGAAAAFQFLDVSSEDSWRAAAEAVARTFGTLDILVNNAAIYRRTDVLGADMTDYDAMYQVNQRGVFLGMRFMAPLMRDKGGSIVNIASASGIKATAGFAGYVGTKYAVRGMTKAAALELAPFGIRVNAVLPGFVDTEMIAGVINTDAAQLQISKLPLRRAGTPTDIARLVCFLASDDSGYSTGADFIADGGLLTGTLK